jgi:hypothetical protein
MSSGRQGAADQRREITMDELGWLAVPLVEHDTRRVVEERAFSNHFPCSRPFHAIPSLGQLISDKHALTLLSGVVNTRVENGQGGRPGRYRCSHCERGLGRGKGGEVVAR